MPDMPKQTEVMAAVTMKRINSLVIVEPGSDWDIPSLDVVTDEGVAEAEKATETLKQANTTTGLSVDRFIQSQAYREEERIAELRQVLESITD